VGFGVGELVSVGVIIGVSLGAIMVIVGDSEGDDASPVGSGIDPSTGMVFMSDGYKELAAIDPRSPCP